VNGMIKMHISSPPHPAAVALPRHRFDDDHGGDDLDEEVLDWVLGQGGRGAGVLAIAMTGMEVVPVDVAMEGWTWRKGPR
jgi:hypothetical protein